MKKTSKGARKSSGPAKASKSSRGGSRTPARRTRKPVRRAAGSRGSAPGAKQLYLERFRRELPVTLAVMRAFPADQPEFRPHERSSTAMRLFHTFAFENFGLLEGTKGDLKVPPDFPPPPATLGEAIDAYERGAKKAIAAIDALPDSRLSETINFYTGPGKMGRIPVLEFFWNLLLDSIHHRGQLSVYVRLAGGRVPSIYGPTADVPWR
jgi:uncharacterized damage-inducible protein DinB